MSGFSVVTPSPSQVFPQQDMRAFRIRGVTEKDTQMLVSKTGLMQKLPE